MPDLCRGGGASPNAAYGTTVTVTSTAVAILLERTLPRDTADFLAPLIAGAAYTLTTICSQPAPTAPTLTTDDMAALANYFDIVNFANAVAKLKDWFLAQYWSLVCVCSDGLPPGTQTIPVPPPVSINPGLPSGGAATPCFDVSGRFFAPAGNATVNLSDQFLPHTSQVTVTPQITGFSTLAWVIPAGTTGYTVTSQQDVPKPAQAVGSVEVFFYNATGGGLGFQTLTTGSGSGQATTTFSLTFPANSVSWQMGLPEQNVTTVGGFIRLQQFCQAGGSSALTTACCPPDEKVDLLLSQILGLVTLIQRQQVPFAYVPKVTHSALTGSGEIAVQGLLGVKVLPASIPPGAGVDLGDPDTLWLDSWINWGNADGWTTREWLRSSPFISMPSVAGQFTKVGYTLRPGLTVDIVELAREP